MMRGLTKNLRRRAAIVIAVAYAFCVVAPAVAVAAVASPTAFHCVGDLNSKAAPAVQTAAHVHDDGTAHRHGQSGQQQISHDQDGIADHHSDAGGKMTGASCCGLFCVLAIAHDPGVTFGVSTPASTAVASMVTGLAGQAPSPLHRPPKA